MDGSKPVATHMVLIKISGGMKQPKRHEKGTCREAGKDRVRCMEDESKQNALHYAYGMIQRIDLINLKSK